MLQIARARPQLFSNNESRESWDDFHTFVGTRLNWNVPEVQTIQVHKVHHVNKFSSTSLQYFLNHLKMCCLHDKEKCLSTATINLNLSEVKNISFWGETKFRNGSTFYSGYFDFILTIRQRRQQNTNATNLSTRWDREVMNIHNTN